MNAIVFGNLRISHLKRKYFYFRFWPMRLATTPAWIMTSTDPLATHVMTAKAILAPTLELLWTTTNPLSTSGPLAAEKTLPRMTIHAFKLYEIKNVSLLQIKIEEP